MQHRTCLNGTLILTVGLLVIVAGCGDDDPLAPVPGVIRVSFDPPDLDASWTIIGPGGYQHSGQGPALLPDLEPGEYTITWSGVPGYITPADVTETLGSDGDTRFHGIYVGQGTIEIVPLPEGLEAEWMLTGPMPGMEFQGTGAETIESAVPGGYTITWIDRTGWTAPPVEVATLDPGATLTFEGAYTVAPALTADQAMAFFRDAYGDRDLPRYEALIHDDFLFVTQEETNYGRDVELVIAQRMFEGLEGAGGYIIGDITVHALEPLGVWQPTATNDPNFGGHPDSLHRPYNIDISFLIEGQNLILRVQGPVIFYVENASDAGLSDYRMLGVVDQTYGLKSTENNSWSLVKEIFR